VLESSSVHEPRQPRQRNITHQLTLAHACPGAHLSISLPRDEASGFVNNKREVYSFQFQHVFPPECECGQLVTRTPDIRTHTCSRARTPGCSSHTFIVPMCMLSTICFVIILARLASVSPAAKHCHFLQATQRDPHPHYSIDCLSTHKPFRSMLSAPSSCFCTWRMGVKIYIPSLIPRVALASHSFTIHQRIARYSACSASTSHSHSNVNVNVDLPRSTGSQQDVFDVVAVPVVDSVLDGYNATIFAYGQTGSGKTFTITGGAERYNDRGIIPRVLTHLFEQFAKRSERVFEAKVCWIALVFAFAS
jgi:hypothetical protein